MKAWKAELILLVITFIWGGTFIFTKIGLNDCPPSLYIFFRFLIAISLSIVFFGKHLLKIERRVFLQGLMLGLLFGGGFLLQTYGLKFTTVSKSAFITGIAVPLTPFAYWLIRRKKIQFWQKAGVVVVTIGLWVFTKPSFDSINLGDALTLASTLFWAFYITLIDMFTKDRESFTETVQLAALQLALAAPFALIAFFTIDGGVLQINLTANLLISLGYNAIFASFIVTLLHTRFQRYTSPVKAALIFSIEPIIASLVAMAVLSEFMNFRELIGAAVLLSGILVSEFNTILLRKNR